MQPPPRGGPSPGEASTVPQALAAADRTAHSDLANAIRALAMDAVEKAKSGHPGLPMGAADVATVLFTQFLKFDAGEPRWPDRDRFVLSAGHGSMLLYALLYLTGVEGMTLDELKRFRQLEFEDAGASRKLHDRRRRDHDRARSARASPPRSAWRSPSACCNAEFGDDLVDHHTYVLASDGDLMEGDQPGGDRACRPPEAQRA